MGMGMGMSMGMLTRARVVVFSLASVILPISRQLEGTAVGPAADLAPFPEGKMVCGAALGSSCGGQPMPVSPSPNTCS